MLIETRLACCPFEPKAGYCVMGGLAGDRQCAIQHHREVAASAFAHQSSCFPRRGGAEVPQPDVVRKDQGAMPCSRDWTPTKPLTDGFIVAPSTDPSLAATRALRALVPSSFNHRASASSALLI